MIMFLARNVAIGTGKIVPHKSVAIPQQCYEIENVPKTFSGK